MRLRILVTLVAASGLAACASGPSSEDPAPGGPEGTLLRVGEVQESVITSEDPTWGDHGRFHLYRFRANADDRLVLEMTSEEFDTYLVIGDKAGGIFNPVSQDDDGGGDLDARIRFVAPETGTYWVLAQAYAADGTGSYVLSLDTMATPRPAIATSLDVGVEEEGLLEESDALDEYDEKHYDVYLFQGQAGQRYSVSLGSADFDAYLVLGQGEGEDFVEITSNDDSGGNTDARIVFTPEETGSYTVRVTSFDGSTGSYTIMVDEMSPPGPLVVTPITIGAERSGSLDDSDQISDDGSYYDLYRFSGREGQRLAITMSSSDIDSYLELGEGDEEFWGDYSDDDSGGDLDARIVVTLWRTGEFTIRANSLYPEETGDYTIAVEELPESGPADVSEIDLGQTIEGSLESSDAMLDDGSYYDIYTFRGTAGQRVRITLRSEDFDSYLHFGRWRNDDIEVSEADDDSGGELDSQLEITIPETGTYGIRANSLGADETGDYTIRLQPVTSGDL